MPLLNKWAKCKGEIRIVVMEFDSRELDFSILTQDQYHVIYEGLN